MKSVVGFSGRAMPKPKEVLAPKKRWKVMDVRGSVKGAVTFSWAYVGGRRRRERESVMKVCMMLAWVRFDVDMMRSIEHNED